MGLDRAGALLTIDLGAVRRNWRVLRDRVGPGVRVGAAIKADAYGLGAARVAPVLAEAGCRDFFTATLDEGIAARAVLPDTEARIFVLNGAPPGTDGEFASHRLIPVLNTPDGIAAWREGPAALHLDSGMCRLGLTPGEVVELAGDPAFGARDIVLTISHLACADEPAHPRNAAQLKSFRDMLARLRDGAGPRAPVSFANSPGIFLGPDYHFDMVRPGAALYGINPTPGKPNPMAEVLRLQGKILQVRDVDRPQAVGYGATHRVAGKGRIATVPVGYADGFARSLGNRASGFLAGYRVPVVGRVSMDLITLDVTDAPADIAAPGAVVDLIGGGRPLDEVAKEAGTIGYEILTGLGARLPRVYVERTA